jgi:hypothetical protein
MKREHMARLLAPKAPPCFTSRDMWTEYVAVRAEGNRGDHEIGPLTFTPGGVVADTDAGLRTAPPYLQVQVLIVKGGTVSFNHQMRYCGECTTAYKKQMQAEKRCNPDHLRELAKELTP